MLQFTGSKTDLGTASGADDGAAQVIEQEFYFPMLAHAPMESLGATIEPTEDGEVIMLDGAQFPTANDMVLGQVLELPPAKAKVNTLYAGGFFGRRAMPNSDYVIETALAFAMTYRSRPAKLVSLREDDITGGYYRPAMAHRVRVGLDTEDEIDGWDHRVAGQSIFKGAAFEGCWRLGSAGGTLPDQTLPLRPAGQSCTPSHSPCGCGQPTATSSRT